MNDLKNLQIRYRSIENHYLSKHVNYNKERFKKELETTIWCVEEKLHGANVSFLLRPNVPIKHFARRFEIFGNEFNSSASLFQFYDARLEKMQKYCDTSGESIRIYGELFGPGINKGVDYGPQKRIRFFNIMVNDTLITPLRANAFTYILGVQDLFIIILGLFNTLDEALEFDPKINSTYSEKEYEEGENICEGVVIKPYNQNLEYMKNGMKKQFYLKNKNEKFLEKKQKSTKKKKHVPIEVHKWHETFLSYIHEQRMESVFSKEGRIDDLRDLGKFIPLIMLDASDTFFKEEEFPVNQFSKNEQRYIFNASKEIVNLLKEELK